METYKFDIDLIAPFFDDEAEISPLLKRWADWIVTKPMGSLGAFSHCLTDDGYENCYDHIAGPEAFKALIPFLEADCMTLCFWRPDNHIGDWPVLICESGGDIMVCPSLEAFLARLASGYFESDEHNFVPLMPEIVHFDAVEKELDADACEGAAEEGEEGREDIRANLAPDLRGDLAAWLLAETGASALDDLMQHGAKLPDFNAWRGTLEDQAWADFQAPLHALTQVMPMHHAMIIWIGDDYRVLSGSEGFYAPPFTAAPDELAEALKPHIQAIRDGWAQKNPGLGLWHTADMTNPATLQDSPMLQAAMGFMDERSLFQKIFDAMRGRKPDSLAALRDYTGLSDGVMFTPHYEYIYPEELNRVIADDADFAADEARFPRAAYRMPKWLKKRLGPS